MYTRPIILLLDHTPETKALAKKAQKDFFGVNDINYEWLRYFDSDDVFADAYAWDIYEIICVGQYKDGQIGTFKPQDFVQKFNIELYKNKDLINETTNCPKSGILNHLYFVADGKNEKGTSFEDEVLDLLYNDYENTVVHRIESPRDLSGDDVNIKTYLDYKNNVKVSPKNKFPYLHPTEANALHVLRHKWINLFQKDSNNPNVEPLCTAAKKIRENGSAKDVIKELSATIERSNEIYETVQEAEGDVSPDTTWAPKESTAAEIKSTLLKFANKLEKEHNKKLKKYNCFSFFILNTKINKANKLKDLAKNLNEDNKNDVIKKALNDSTLCGFFSFSKCRTKTLLQSVLDAEKLGEQILGLKLNKK